MSIRFTVEGDNLVKLEFEVPGYGTGESLFTLNQAEALRDQLDRSINVQRTVDDE